MDFFNAAQNYILFMRVRPLPPKKSSNLLSYFHFFFDNIVRMVRKNRHTKTEARNFSSSNGSNLREESQDFELLMKTQGPTIYTLAVRLTGDLTEGQDLAQETFIRAYKSFDQFRGESSFATWVYRICVNLWKNKLRDKSKRSIFQRLCFWRKNEDDEEEFYDPPGVDKPLDGALELEERQRLLQNALKQLDPEERAVLILREAEDKPYEEIARLLVIPIGTVKSRIARGREHLRGLLKFSLTEPV